MAVGTAKDVKVAVTLPSKPMLVGVRIFPMTNTVAVKSGEELLFEVVKPSKPSSKALDWKADLKRKDKDNATSSGPAKKVKVSKDGALIL